MLVELRRTRLHASRVADFLKMHGSLPKPIQPSLVGVSQAGGLSLNTALRLWAYPGGLRQRDELAQMDFEEHFGSRDVEWSVYNGIAQCTVDDVSTIYAEATKVLQDNGIEGVSAALGEEGVASSDAIYELRNYQLVLGYDTVPKFLELYGNGLPSKLAAEGTDPSTSLVTLLYSEIGPLNNVVELWRHGGGSQAMERSRVAARGANQWRSAIANVAKLAQSFDTSIIRPMTPSQWF
mmetsp:Transcript_6645/g.14498  ORF Transcript_6645/g.14498 Transcript_6645/m.14498 type:complete len:237 (+) Transcript_6645:126-836(+)